MINQMKSGKRKRRGQSGESVFHSDYIPNGQVYVGRTIKGLWPDVSRTRLAKAVGKDISTVSKYLNGSVRMPLEIAVPFAEIIGVTGETLLAKLEKARKIWIKRQDGNVRSSV